MGQAPSEVLAVFLLRSCCLALVLMEILPFLSLSVTNLDEFVWTGSAAIVYPKTGSIGFKQWFVGLFGWKYCVR